MLKRQNEFDEFRPNAYVAFSCVVLPLNSQRGDEQKREFERQEQLEKEKEETHRRQLREADDVECESHYLIFLDTGIGFCRLLDWLRSRDKRPRFWRLVRLHCGDS